MPPSVSSIKDDNIFGIFKFSMQKPIRKVGSFIPPVGRGEDSIISSGYPISKPAVVIVHGMLQDKIHYNYLVTLLNLEGYDAYYPNLPSNCQGKSTTKMYDDAAVIKRVLEKLIQQNQREVIVLMHCYGGIPGTQAVTQNLTKKWRERYGLEGGVVHLMYVSAFMLPLGESLASTVAKHKVYGGDGRWEDMFLMLADGRLVLKDAPDRMYNDMILAAKKPDWWATFSSQTMFHTHLLDPLSNAQYYAVRSTYLVCENDRFIPEDGQLTMIEHMLERGLELEMESCNGGHLPFLRAPQTIVEVINNLDLTPDYGRSLDLDITDANRQDLEGGMF